MKKTLIAASLVLGLASASSVMAGGIQLQPAGTGVVPGSKFLSDSSLGSTFGNLLAENIFGSLAEQALGDPATGWVYGHNSLGLSSFGIAGELTLEMELAVFPSVTGTANTVGEQLAFLLDGSRTSTFRLYYDDGTNVNADMASGAGYGDGVLIASSTYVTIQGGAALTNTSGGVSAQNGGKLDDQAGAVDTIGSSGSIFVDIDFKEAESATNFVDTDYIVNGLYAVTTDLTTDNSLVTPYPNNTFASTSVVGHSLDEGSDAINNFQCISGSAGVGECDFQAKMNTTFIVDAGQVPEPGSLALLGMGLGLMGVRAARRNRKS